MRAIVESQPQHQSQSYSAANVVKDEQPAKDNRFDLLLQGLNGNADPPAKQVNDQQAPPTPATTVKPLEDNDEVDARYDMTQSIQGLVSLYFNIARASKMGKEGRTEFYKISDPIEANKAFAEIADLTYGVMSSSLAGYLETPKYFTNSYSKNVAKNEFKTAFTKDIFAGFGLGKQALDEIATFIQNYLAAIGSIQINSSSTSNVRSFANNTNTVVKVDVLSDGKHIVYQPRVHLVYMKIDHEAFKIATKTCLGETDTERFTFYMTYTVVQADVNYRKMQQDQAKLDKTFNTITQDNLNKPQQSLHEFSKEPGISQETVSDEF